MTGEAFVDKGVVSVDHITSRSIAGNEVGEVEPRLLNHRVDEPPVTGILWIKITVRVGVIDLVELEPGIEELLHESLRFGLVEQAVDLDAQRLGFAQFALLGESAE